jgi:acyl-CoA reductase-like NAD-dependent aldehyde dehydrogenase
MSAVDPREIESILGRVRSRFGGAEPAHAGPAELEPPPAASSGPGIYATIDEAVAAARHAFESFRDLGLDARRQVIDSVRAAMRGAAEELARAAHLETGLGRAEDKIRKNLLVTEKTPGPEDLEPRAVTGDDGMTVTEFAPFGVVAAIAPTTNPTATIINNTIAIVSAGNGVVFNPHPYAKRVSVDNVVRINQAIVAAGGPPNLVCTVPEPTIESAQELMRHRNVRLLMVTGGPAVVDEALKTKKRAITAGPGNPPVVVDDSADVGRAARGIVAGASFDNNMVCTDEKIVIAHRDCADELLRAMGRSDAYLLKEYQLKQLEKVIFDDLGPPRRRGRINRKWIGQNAGRILAQIGVPADDDLRLVVAEVPQEHSLVWTEQMMPVMPLVRVADVDEGINLAVAAEHGYGHTASIYSNDVEAITRMARRMNCSIFVANGPNYAGLGAGGEDFTSFSIATPTGEGHTRPRSFSRIRRLSVVGSLRIV